MAVRNTEVFVRPASLPSARLDIRRLLAWALMLLVGAVMLIYILMPIYWMVKSSFQTNLEVNAIPPVWLPSSLTLATYERALDVIPLGRYMGNSLFVSLATAVIATTIASMAAYVLARYRFPGATLILVTILFTQLIPTITRVFPIYFLIQDLGLLNSYVGLILTYCGFSVPYAVLMLRGYFKTSCPPELEEAALIDGCSRFSAFWRVVLPISRPGLAAIGTFTFLGAWNEFLWASLLMNRGQMKTIQVGLRDFLGEMSGAQYINAYMAACVMATIPALILFIFIQRWLVSGISTGSIKG